MSILYQRLTYCFICLNVSICVLAQNVGIGTGTPTGPLSFGNFPNQENILSLSSADNIAKSSDGSVIYFNTNYSDFYGFPYYHDMAFGHGYTGAFAERMRLTGQGYAGIGVSNPAYEVDVTGRIRARLVAGDKGFAGISFSDAAGSNNYGDISVTGSIIGMQFNNAGYKWQYNPTTMALAFAGSYGNTDMVLTSGGPNGAATWMASTYKQQYDGSIQLFEPNAYQLSTNGSSATLAGLSFTINKKSMVDYSVAVSSNYCFGCAPTVVKLELIWNNTDVIQSTTHSILNGYTTTISGNRITNSLNNSTYSVSVRLTKVSGPTLNIPAAAGQLAGLTAIPVPAQ